MSPLPRTRKPVLFMCFMLGLSMVQSISEAQNNFRTRSAVLARNGMVATSQPLAAQAGLDILRRGGNAVDAAIATNAMLGLVEPASCGIGGDLFAIVWDAKTKKLYGLNASGRAPYAHTLALFNQRGIKEIPTQGPLSWSVPGCVSGWDELRTKFGTKSFEELLAAAIEYGDKGFPVSPMIAGDWRGAERGLSRFPDSAKTFLIEGKPPAPARSFATQTSPPATA